MDYTKQAIAIKGTVAAVFAFLTALLGWFGWLCVALAAMMLLDYISGSRVAIKKEEWSSEKAKQGIWHKFMMVLVVLGTGILDLVLGTVLANIPAIPLPFNYTVLFCPLVVVWYILTELGSLLENAVAAGVPMPDFLLKVVKGLKVAVTNAGDKQKEEKEG